MLKLMVPEYAHREIDGDGKWHFMWGDTPGPFMVCGVYIRRRETVSIDTLEDNAEVCSLCLGAMVISLDNSQK